MKLYAALCFLAVAGCATTSSLQTNAEQASLEGGGGPGGSSQVLDEPVRMETSAGTFLVSPWHAEDFKKALSGEPTPMPFYAGADVE